MKQYLSNKNFVTGMTLIAVLLAVLCVSFVWLPYDPEEMNIRLKFDGMSLLHPLGTDQFGRDILSRIMKGMQSSFAIGLCVVIAGGVIGTILGAFSGYFGGFPDEIIMKFIDSLMAFPGILLAMMLMAVFGNGTANTVLALSILSVPRFVRMARSGFMRLRDAEFVKAERVRGASSLRIMFIHILPNQMSELIATASLTFASAVMAEAGLSYLGLGIVPPNPSLGLMLSEAQDHIFRAPWYIAIPAVVITLLVMGFNLLGDGIQEVQNR